MLRTEHSKLRLIAGFWAKTNKNQHILIDMGRKPHFVTEEIKCCLL